MSKAVLDIANELDSELCEVLSNLSQLTCGAEEHSSRLPHPEKLMLYQIKRVAEVTHEMSCYYWKLEGLRMGIGACLDRLTAKEQAEFHKSHEERLVERHLEKPCTK